MAGLEQRRIADLDCLVYTTTRPPELLLILCHGFGAPGDDLVPLGAHLLRMQPELLDRVQIVFPAALLDLAEIGMPRSRAWWMLDMEKLQRAMQLGEFRDMRNENPPGLTKARESLERVIAALQQESGLDWSHTVLGGFSQGAMLTTDVTLHAPENPAGLLIWSGTLLCEEQWREIAPRRAGLPIIQSHGRQDSILPFKAAEWLRDLLSDAGTKNEFLSFNGPHTIPQEAIERSAELLLDLLD